MKLYAKSGPSCIGMLIATVVAMVWALQDELTRRALCIYARSVPRDYTIGEQARSKPGCYVCKGYARWIGMGIAGGYVTKSIGVYDY